ncbi:putative gustatory receptor 28b [Vespula squamosa]|uniref:Gustatory receptor 28b n=1 Tax=Vespula squamosa TaxID=30214 RepID=A0ABD2AXZ2_VESSQ
MKNLIEKFRKQENIRDISRSDRIKYERKKSIRDVLRPIYILDIIFGLRVFEFPRNRSRSILSFFYSMSLFCLCYMLWSYQEEQINHTMILTLDKTVTNIILITQKVTVFIILIMGLYQSETKRDRQNASSVRFIGIFQQHLQKNDNKHNDHNPLFVRLIHDKYRTDGFIKGANL